ncbi:hypothetical protein C4H11_13990 [Bacteroides zoogleoformans]|uniref:Uncharacterized protein n=1 Tax=Bacteroides zoogleoformans TaxID=28119 RepID=A0ABM6TAQ8_9BACE|nr:hypothetical protein C4H11_13990 [Bacteroides zoogleoformans]
MPQWLDREDFLLGNVITYPSFCFTILSWISMGIIKREEVVGEALKQNSFTRVPGLSFIIPEWKYDRKNMQKWKKNVIAPIKKPFLPCSS